MHFLSAENIFLFLFQFFILLTFAKGLGLVLEKMKQPTVTADILVGIIAGPTIFGRFFPGIRDRIFPADPVQWNMMETVAWIGILFLLMETGLSVNFAGLWKQRRKAFRLALAGLILPIVFSIIPVYLLPARFLIDPDKKVLFTVFICSILAISAMPVAIRALYDLNLLKTDMGSLTLSALSINDILGWVVFTAAYGFFSRSSVNFREIAAVLTATVLFSALALTLGRSFAAGMLSWIKKHFQDKSGIQLTFIVLLGAFCGTITGFIGIQALLGFFIAGIIAGESSDLSEKDRYVITRMVYAVFIPVFFINIGLKIDFLAGFNIPLVAFFTVFGITARFSGAYAGTLIAKVPATNRLPISIAHTAGGEMHIVLGLLAYQTGLITRTIFISLVCGAIISTITLGPLLSLVSFKKRKIRPYSLLSENGIIPEIKGRSKVEAIRELCSRGAQITGMKDEDILEPVTAREEILSSSLGQGVAVPHARLESIQKPALILGKSTAGIDWNSPDGQPSHFIFLILTPADEKDIQLQILSSLAEKMQDEKIREKLMLLKTGKDIFEYWNNSGKILSS